MNNQHFLKSLKNKLIIGVDEVGRGSWAGPLVVGAVMLDIGAPIIGLKDSKQIVKQQRQLLAAQIEQMALKSVTGWVWPAEIDELGLTAATTLAIERALHSFGTYDHVVIDGSINYLPTNSKVLTCVKADSFVSAVSAASIVAKVARDEYMAAQAEQYPQYGFELHVGYGTARHKNALVKYGVTSLHRRSFGPVRQLLQ